MSEPEKIKATDDDAVDDDKLAAEWESMAGAEADGDAASAGGAQGDSPAPNQDQLADEWVALAEGEGGEEADESLAAAATTQPARVLNQAEIDSLLGFDQDEDSRRRSGIQAILNSTLVSYERLPMLEVAFDRAVRLLTTSLRKFTSDNVEVSIDGLTSVRFGDYLNSIPLPAMLGVFKAEEWDDFGLITTDSALIYSVVDVLLGGGHGTAPIRIEGRPYTTIERNLVERMIQVVLADLTAAFEPLTPVTFRFDRLETNPRFAAIARPANAAILARMRVDMDNRGGNIEVVLPYATLEPIRDLLLQMFWGEKFGRDSIWENHLATELWNTTVVIEAVLDEQVMALRDVANLKIGDTFMLGAQPNSLVVLRCGGVPMVSGRMGRTAANVAIRVDRTHWSAGAVK
ncbi:MAG: flagellar motor switch protein FliM [Alphaproteobacteria bacterium]